MDLEEKAKLAARKDALARMAVWQILAFVFLLCFVWAAELLDIPAWMFGAEPTPFSLYRACILSAAVIAAGVTAVGHTYEEQRRLLKKLLHTCMYCHRVAVNGENWEHVDEYFIRHYPVTMDRCVCPSCDRMLEKLQKKKGNVDLSKVESILDLIE